MSDAPQSDEVEVKLYQLDSSDKALWLTRGGTIATAHWIPRKFAKQASETHYTTLSGKPVIEAVFAIARWKAKELGWLASEDEGQGSLSL